MTGLNLSKRVVSMLLVVLTAVALAVAIPEHAIAASGDRIFAHGGGTTIIEGGTGAPDFVPVLTTIAFHAERTGASVTGAFECLARAPESPTGAQSAQFSVNVMYVTGQITGGIRSGDTATLTGTATVTGLGAGSNLPFTLVVRGGGPGATAVLTVSGLVFKEILLEGAFRIF